MKLTRAQADELCALLGVSDEQLEALLPKPRGRPRKTDAKQREQLWDRAALRLRYEQLLSEEQATYAKLKQKPGRGNAPHNIALRRLATEIMHRSESIASKAVYSNKVERLARLLELFELHAGEGLEMMTDDDLEREKEDDTKNEG